MRNRMLVIVGSFLGVTQLMCGVITGTQLSPEQEITPLITEVRIPDSYSNFCMENGYRFELRPAADDSLIGVCILLDGSECPAAEYYEGECGSFNQTTRSIEQKAVEAAKIVLAKELNLDASQISLFSLEQVTWMDDCLAIQSSGDICKMVPTPGFRLILQVGNNVYTYHTDLSAEKVRAEGGVFQIR